MTHAIGERCPWPKTCTCEHEVCDRGWTEGMTVDPRDGVARNVVRKCPACTGVTEHTTTEVTPSGETYADRKSRAAG